MKPETVQKVQYDITMNETINSLSLSVLHDFSKCDSPIEDIFYAEVQKLIVPDAVIFRQPECITRNGTFYLDFLIQVGKRRVGFECDGKDFHDNVRDSSRDKAIIESGYANRIYRLRGRDIVFHFYDAMDLIRVRDRSLFSERGHHIIKSLSSRTEEYMDESVRPTNSFPSAAVRWYKRDPEEYNDTDVPIKPTAIFWT